jgi:hypothetical protein
VFQNSQGFSCIAQLANTVNLNNQMHLCESKQSNAPGSMPQLLQLPESWLCLMAPAQVSSLYNQKVEGCLYLACKIFLQAILICSNTNRSSNASHDMCWETVVSRCMRCPSPVCIESTSGGLSPSIQTARVRTGWVRLGDSKACLPDTLGWNTMRYTLQQKTADECK